MNEKTCDENQTLDLCRGNVAAGSLGDKAAGPGIRIGVHL